ncbi:MAG: hypothetical protein ALECFALPRED_002820 [Alectoria fallacina]|uniref:PWWP domain-containing protein n=1 Tax=Alectoria fallacina TaxID=1903189 RepID=A0A8H3FKY0_9LECA|nr:MAG: hypothetical protein ALECFALPRED_002820 [Alectoria fallacina]
MAEESNMALSNPATSGAETENSQQDNGAKATDIAMDEGNSELPKEGAEQEEAAETTKTNGDTNHATDDKPSTSALDTQDTEMPDTAETGDARGAESSPAVPPINGTPAPSKRASTGGSSRKKSSAVPEHKSKKLNKKKSRPLTNLNAQPGEYYIARMKGHPPWPSVICDEDMLPQSLLTTRPVTAALEDGTFKRTDYADGGKRAHERTFPIMFLHTNEFAWIPNTELTPLDVESETTKNPVEKGKSKTLIAAYSKAAENHDLAHFKTMLADHQKAIEIDEELKEEKAAKKTKKASRKSGDATAVADDAEEMDIDDEAAAEKPKSKKRKKADDSDDADEKPAKTPKTATKLKLTTPKTPATEPSSKKKTAKPKVKATATKSGSEEEVVTPKVEEKPPTPAQMKEMKEKKVLYYRHKLQRGFLSRDTMPKEDEMKSMSDFLSELETYPDLEGSIIRTTKIHKVLRQMLKLPSIPLDEEFHFKTRSLDLLAKWNETLSNDPNGGGAGDRDDEAKPEVSTIAPATNGETSKDVEEQAEKAEAGEAAAPEEENEEKLENKIGTTVEGEPEAEKAEEATATQQEKTAEEEKTDGPAIESAPEKEYKPPVADGTVEATA